MQCNKTFIQILKNKFLKPLPNKRFSLDLYKEREVWQNEYKV